MLADLMAITTPWTAKDYERTGTTPREAISYILTEHLELIPAAIDIIERLRAEQEVKKA